MCFKIALFVKIKYTKTIQTNIKPIHKKAKTWAIARPTLAVFR